MAHLALRLLGPLEILLDGQPVTMIKRAKARERAVIEHYLGKGGRR